MWSSIIVATLCERNIIVLQYTKADVSTALMQPVHWRKDMHHKGSARFG